MIKSQRFGVAKSLDVSGESKRRFGEVRKEQEGARRREGESTINKTSRNAFNGMKEAQRRRSSDLVRIPLVVHCSAGIGRTGCFLAVLNGIQQLRNSMNVDVLAILCSLRLNRGGMVQTAEQYELIHRVLNLFAEAL
ncbi:hypothetical protein HHI36_021385 [Cryptolaemus montrouzieri]|uniref:protein-tyrosine-phosphatase n=1 Tax=Cryptolaemus montrouzieri TaxID=559131 RepID=A0ABD2MWS4_9CUCU